MPSISGMTTRIALTTTGVIRRTRARDSTITPSRTSLYRKQSRQRWTYARKGEWSHWGGLTGHGQWWFQFEEYWCDMLHECDSAVFTEYWSISIRSDGDQCWVNHLIAASRGFDLSVRKRLCHLSDRVYFFLARCVLQVLALLQDRQSTQSQSTPTTQLTDDERTVESQALINLKKAVEKHSGHFFGSRQQVNRLTQSSCINASTEDVEISVESPYVHVEKNNVDPLSNRSRGYLYWRERVHRNASLNDRWAAHARNPHPNGTTNRSHCAVEDNWCLLHSGHTWRSAHCDVAEKNLRERKEDLLCSASTKNVILTIEFIRCFHISMIISDLYSIAIVLIGNPECFVDSRTRFIVPVGQFHFQPT